MKILYKRTSTGAIQQWSQQIDGNKYRTISGQKDGQLVVSQWTECIGKNLGKSNETTPEAQAIKEVAANYKKKIEQKGYSEDISNIDEETFFKPMLAKEYTGKIDFPVWTQPKLDGIRCIVTKNGMFTRNGKTILSCPHIYKEIQKLFNSYETSKSILKQHGYEVSHKEMVFDGELYNHELKHDFNKIVSLVKKQKPSEADLKESEKIIQYHIYDYPANWPFSYRTFFLNKIPEHIKLKSIKIVKTQKVENQKTLDDIYEEFLKDGYEGQMIRLDKEYENKRSKNLLKRKPSHSQEYLLIDIESGIGNYAGIAKIATLQMPDGRIFGAGIAGSQERNRQILLDKNKYIGNKTTVEFIGFTPDGIPRFGRVKEFNRDDND